MPTGTTARRKPIRLASASLRPMPATLRISPASPTSPNATTSDGRHRSVLRAREREHDGEVYRRLGQLDAADGGGVDIAAAEG